MADRQLSKKYPRIVVEVQEDKEVPNAPADMSGPNPNGMGASALLQNHPLIVWQSSTTCTST